MAEKKEEVKAVKAEDEESKDTIEAKEAKKEVNEVKKEAKEAKKEADEAQKETEVKPAKEEKGPETKKAAPAKKAKKEGKSAPVKKTEKVKKEEEKEVKKPKTTNALSMFSEIRKDLPIIKPGDVVRVSYRVIEGGKERTQIFEGVVIAKKNSGVSKTITVRKTSFGIAVERILPLNSKLVQKIEVKKHSKVRRAKLYYLRNLRGKAARLKELR